MNPDGKLVAGMYAETALDLVKKDAALTIPIQAVSRNGDEVTVLVVDAQNRVQQKHVQLGLEGVRRIEVVNGLQEADRVVIGSRSQFHSGDVVEPRPIAETEKDREDQL